MNKAQELHQRALNAKERNQEYYTRLAAKAYQSIHDKLVAAADRGDFHLIAGFLSVDGVCVEWDEDFESNFIKYLGSMGFEAYKNELGNFHILWENVITPAPPPTIECLNR